MLKETLKMTNIDIVALIEIIKVSLNDAINDTFKTTFNAIQSPLGALNSLNIGQLTNNITNSLTDTFDTINELTSNIVTDIGGYLLSPIQDMLDIGEFIVFLNTLKMIIFDNVALIMKVRIGFELIKPLLFGGHELTRSLYGLLEIPVKLIMLNLESRYSFYLIKFQYKLKKRDIRSSFRRLDRESKFILTVSQFFYGIVFFIMALGISQLLDTRRDVIFTASSGSKSTASTL